MSHPHSFLSHCLIGNTSGMTCCVSCIKPIPISFNSLICLDCLKLYMAILPPKPIEEVKNCFTCGCFFKTHIKHNIYCHTCHLVSNKLFVKRKIISDPFKIGNEGPLPSLPISDEENKIIDSVLHPTLSLDITYTNPISSKIIIYRLPLPIMFKYCDFKDDGTFNFSIKSISKTKLITPPPFIECRSIVTARLVKKDSSLSELWKET